MSNTKHKGAGMIPGQGSIDSILSSTISSSNGNSNSTRIMLNNLVEFYYPFRTSKFVQTKCSHVGKEMIIEVKIELPCMALAQKVDIEIEEMFSAQDDFANVFLLERVMHEKSDDIESQGEFTDSIMIRKSKDLEVNPEFEDQKTPTIIQDDSIEEVVEDSMPNQNKQSLKFLSISSNFKIILKVRQGFGFLNGNNTNNPNQSEDSCDLNEKSSRKSLIQDEIRSISRNMQHSKGEEKTQQAVESKFSEREAEEIFQRAIMSIVKGIRFHAWPCFRIPPSNALIPLMNASFIFETKCFGQQKKDLDFLVALSLISGRKFIQACELFRKLQSELFQKPEMHNNVIDKAIQLEILIADSMNQHSQLKEKIHAFQRAVELSQKKKNTLGNMPNFPTNDEDGHKLLMKLHPQLIKILLQYVDSKIEALKVAVLRSIEFLIDQLGCSLDLYLIRILGSVIKSYPRSNFQSSSAQNQLIMSNIQIPKRHGFFQELQQQNINPSDLKFERAFENSFLNSIIFDISNPTQQVIKDGQNFQSSYISCIKNLQNHILESFISLLSSMSSYILHQIFNDIILKTIFLNSTLGSTSNPFEMQLATDLRIYLLKFMDKIVNICSGDLVLSPQFLNSILDCMYPSLQQAVEGVKKQSGFLGGGAAANQTEEQQIIQAEAVKAREKSNQTISLACQNLWSTFKSRLFVNYSNKGMKSLLEWIFNKLVMFAESAEEQKLLTSDQAQKLNQVFDLIEVITQNTNSSNKPPDGNEGQRSNSRQLITLELYALINPLIFWLDYSIERPDRLPLFKLVWRTLNILLNQLPQKKLDIDTLKIILPILQRVNNFCLTSSPPLEMLQFLLIVLGDFVKQGPPLRKNSRKQLSRYLDNFLVTLSKCVPHHLNEEIFQLCETIIELQLLLQPFSTGPSASQDDKKLREKHLCCMLDALTDKYTMRSKAHKRLTKFVLQNVIIDESLKQIKLQQNAKERNNPPKPQQASSDIHFNNQARLDNQMLNRSNEQMHQQRQPLDILLHVDNYASQQNNNNGQQQQQYLAGIGSGSGTAAVQQLHHSIHQRATQQHNIMRHNNNDLGLVVNHDDVELSRDFQQQQQQQQAVNNYDYDEVESLINNQQDRNNNNNDLNNLMPASDNYEDEDDLIIEEHIVAGSVGIPVTQALQNELEIEGNNMIPHGQVPVAQQHLMIDTSSQEMDETTEVLDYRRNQQNESSSGSDTIEITTNFDIFIDICFLKIENPFNNQAQTSDKHKEALSQERFIEKLGLFLQLVKLLQNTEHVPLFYKLLRRNQELLDAITSIYLHNDELQSTSQSAMEILELISKFFMQNCIAKNIYEYPIITLQRVKDLVVNGDLSYTQAHQVHNNLLGGIHNNNQHSQSSGHMQQQLQLQQQQQHQFQQQRHQMMNRNGSYFSSSHPIIFPGNQLVNQNILSSTVHSQQYHPLLPQVVHRQIGSSGFNQMGVHDDFIIGTDIIDPEAYEEEDVLFSDEVDVINSDRLIIIKLYTSLIKLSTDSLAKKQGSGDAHIQFHALNMLDNMFANLLPVPSLLNVFMRHYTTLMASQPVQNPARPRILSNSVHSAAGSDHHLHHYNVRESRQQTQVTDNHNQSTYFDLERQQIVQEAARQSQSASQRNASRSYHHGIQSPMEGAQILQALPAEFETIDQSYLDGRIQLCLKVWKFLEDSLTKSSWSTIKSISFGVIYQVLRGVSLIKGKSIENSRSVSKLKSLVLPLVNQLLNSKESESKAGGLNILGAICGLGLDLGLNTFSRYFKLQDYLPLFRIDHHQAYPDSYKLTGSKLIQVSLWQRLFQLSDEDWDPTIRDAASLLIQICAPRTSIIQFHTIAQEKYQIKLQQMVNSFQIKRTQVAELSESCSEGENESSNSSIGSSEEDKNQGDDDENAERSHKLSEEEEIKKYFYIDRCSEDQIREILAIFRNDYKPPPKNLWVEKNGQNNQQPDNLISDMKDILEDRIVDRLNYLYQQNNKSGETQAQAISNVYDQFFYSSNNGGLKQAITAQKKKKGTNEIESEYLIFERHFDDKKGGQSNVDDEILKKNGDADNSSQGATDSANHEEDLGIIDLDELEKEDGIAENGKDSLAFFDDQFDDDKLPVLKNTYSKKHRPNNSKSVAIGSKTQTMLVMSTPVISNGKEEQQQQFLAVPTTQAKINPLDRPESAGRPRGKDFEPHIREESKEKRCHSLKNLGMQQPQQQACLTPTQTAKKSSDQVLDEYEMRIAQSIANLSSELKQKHTTNITEEEGKGRRNVLEEAKTLDIDATKRALIKSIPHTFSPTNNRSLIKSRTPKDEGGIFHSQSYEEQKSKGGIMNSSLDHPNMSHSLNIDQQQINVQLTQQQQLKSTLLKRAMGSAATKVRASLNISQQATNTVAAANNKVAPVGAPPAKQTGPLINAISSGMMGTSSKRYAAPPKSINKTHLTANSSLKLLDSCFQQQSFSKQPSKKFKVTKQAAPVQQSISQQARAQITQQYQTSVVSRAKSQSYLNQTQGASMPIGTQTPGSLQHQTSIRTNSKKKATSFTNKHQAPPVSKYRGVSGNSNNRLPQSPPVHSNTHQSLMIQPQVNNFLIEDNQNQLTLGVQMILSPKSGNGAQSVKRPRPQAGYHSRHTNNTNTNNNQEHQEDLIVINSETFTKKAHEKNEEEFDIEEEEDDDLAEFIGQDDDEGDSTSDFFPRKQVQ